VPVPNLRHLLASTLLAFVATAHAQPARIDPDGLVLGEQHDRFIVQYRAEAKVTDLGAARERVRRAVEASPSAYATATPTVLHAMAPGAYVVRSSKPMSVVAAETWMRRLAEDPAIEFVEVDVRLREHAQPNDKWYTSQLHLFGPHGVGADAAWGMNQGMGIYVGVVDSGPTPHPDLDAALLRGYDFVDNDTNPMLPECTLDGGTHGTKTAGTIAAITNNARGVASVAPDVKIVPARVISGCGGPLSSAWTSDIIRAIDWLSGGAVEGVPANLTPVEVINISLSNARETCSESKQAAIARAVGRGTTIVVSAGNANFDVSGAQPANCNGVIVVGGVDVMGQRNDFSNWGGRVDIAAPGQIYWPTFDDETLLFAEGTSFAAPMVTAIVALMQSASPTPLEPALIETLLKASTRPFGATPDKPLGSGIANAPAALTMAQSIHAPKFRGAYTLVARARASGVQHNGCLVVGALGHASSPSFYRWEGNGAPETCGVGDDDALVAHGQAVWDIHPITDRNGVTAHAIRSRVNGKCLIRSNNGNNAAPSLYVWGNNTDMTWCGLPDADTFIANGQAAWYFDTPASQPGPEIVTTAGLKQIRPRFAFLGFKPTATPDETRFSLEREWEFRFHPVPALPENVFIDAPFFAINQGNGECLDMRGGTSTGTPSITWPCHAGSNQRFTYLNQQILVDGRCLDVERDLRVRSTPVIA